MHKKCQQFTKYQYLHTIGLYHAIVQNIFSKAYLAILSEIMIIASILCAGPPVFILLTVLRAVKN